MSRVRRTQNKEFVGVQALMEMQIELYSSEDNQKPIFSFLTGTKLQFSFLLSYRG